MISPSPASSDLVEHISAHSGSLPWARRLVPYFSNSAGAIGALVHLAARAEIADARILRRAERAGVEAVAAADADVLRMQHHRVLGRIERVGRAHRRARRVGAMHAGHRDRALAGLAVIDGDDAPPVDAPRHFVFVLAGGDASVALDATVGIAQEFHPSH